MKDFIFDYYGYNVPVIKDNSFIYNDYTFIIFAVNDTEESLIKLDNLLYSLRNSFNDDIVYIVKNKYNKYISQSTEDYNITLLCYKNKPLSNINDFIKMNVIYLNYFNYKVNLKDIIALWDQRLEYIQNQCLVNLNFDNESHLILYKFTQYSVGLALNSLQYLKDITIDFNKITFNATLTHRRIKNINKYELFNPFNLIIDHSSRDLAELYKNDLIDFNTLINITSYFNYSVDEYEYLLARLLYPTFIFDILEDLYNEKTNYDYTNQICIAINKQKKALYKLKEYYENIYQYITIRPIDWIKEIII